MILLNPICTMLVVHYHKNRTKSFRLINKNDPFDVLKSF